MNGQHTPGPWIVKRAGGIDVMTADRRLLIADCAGNKVGGYEESQANALLIAAVPDLLEALKALLRESVNESGAPLRPSREAIATAQAAVVKAVGA
jgi:hypothetical protein